MSHRRAIAATTVAIALAVTMSGAHPAQAAEPLTDAQVSAAVAQLDTLVPEYLTRSGVPGVAVAVVHGDEVLYAKGFGVRDVDTGAPVTADTVFQLASVSKPIGASVIAGAIGRGIVSWDDSVKKHLPWFTLSDPYVTKNATIGDMYAMRSGLPGQAGDVLELFGYTRRQILERLRELPLDPFRISYHYTDFGMTMGAQAVAVAAGKPWAELSADLVYQPLRMTSTSSTYRDFLAQPNRAELHVKENGAYASRYWRDPDAQSSAGGVSSNVIDVAKWLRMELGNGTTAGKQVVDAEALATANNSQIRKPPVNLPAALPQYYGYGMNIFVDGTGRVNLGHSGAFTAGGGTNVQMLPDSGLGIVTLTNAEAGLAEAISMSFIDFAEHGRLTADWLDGYLNLFEAMHAEDPAFEPPARPTAARATADLVGRYANDFYGTAVVVAKAGRISIVMGPNRTVVPLEHWSGDRFIATFAVQTAPTKVWVDFGGKPGPATTLTLHVSDDPTAKLTRQG